MGIFEEWAKNNIGDKALTKEEEKRGVCVARVLNRIGADTRRADDIAVRLLAARLADRLGCNTSLKGEALFRLSAFIYGFYQGAEEALKSANIQV